MQKDKDNLIRISSEKLIEDPDHIKALTISASAYTKNQNDDKGIADCNTLHKVDNNNANAYYMRGILYQKIGNLEQAITDFTECLTINPDHYNAAYARGACEYKLGNFLKAIEDYDFDLEKDKKLFHTTKRNSTNSPTRIQLPNSCKKDNTHI